MVHPSKMGSHGYHGELHGSSSVSWKESDSIYQLLRDFHHQYHRKWYFKGNPLNHLGLTSSKSESKNLSLEKIDI